MNFELILAGGVAVVLLIYLVYTLFYPENF